MYSLCVLSLLSLLSLFSLILSLLSSLSSLSNLSLLSLFSLSSLNKKDPGAKRPFSEKLSEFLVILSNSWNGTHDQPPGKPILGAILGLAAGIGGKPKFQSPNSRSVFLKIGVPRTTEQGGHHYGHKDYLMNSKQQIQAR